MFKTCPHTRKKYHHDMLYNISPTQNVLSTGTAPLPPSRYRRQHSPHVPNDAEKLAEAYRTMGYYEAKWENAERQCSDLRCTIEVLERENRALKRKIDQYESNETNSQHKPIKNDNMSIKTEKSLGSEKTNKNLQSREYKPEIGKNETKKLAPSNTVNDWSIDFKNPKYIEQFTNDKYKNGLNNPTLTVVKNSYIYIAKRYEDRGSEKPILHLFSPWKKMAQNTYRHWFSQKGEKTAQESLKFLLQAFHLQLKRVTNYSKFNLAKAINDSEADFNEIVANKVEFNRKVIPVHSNETNQIPDCSQANEMSIDDCQEKRDVVVEPKEDDDETSSEPPATPKLYYNNSDFKPDYDEYSDFKPDYDE